VTTHDEFAISWTRKEAIEKVERFLSTKSESEARELFTLCSQSQWNYGRAKKELANGDWRKQAVQVLYRPFDLRWTIWNSNVAVHRRERANKHLLEENLAILLPKQTKDAWGCLVTNHVAAHKSASVYDPTSIAPLWIYPDKDLLSGSTKREANLSVEFKAAIAAATAGKASKPRDIFSYIYAALYSPSYRAKFGDFLKRGFPRVPLPTNAGRFQEMITLGEELIGLHLLEKTARAITSYPEAGSDQVEKVEFKLHASNPKKGRVYINAEQFFDDVPVDVWQYSIGGYQVAHKWLKDRKDRQLTFDELKVYGEVIAALARTISIQSQIDAVLR
jgi:predicted helicase